jgi:hypothetical protein
MDLIYQNYKKNSIIFDTTGEKRGFRYYRGEKGRELYPLRDEIVVEAPIVMEDEIYEILSERWKMPADSS